MTTKVTLLLLNDDVDLAVVGFSIAHKFAFCDITRPDGNESVILLSVACAVKGDDIMNETDATPEEPTALLNDKAFRAATTDPTAGVPIFAATVSTDVWMLIPPLNAAVEGLTTIDDAARAAKVNPEQVIVFWPAERSAFKSTTMRWFAESPLLSVTDAVDGFGTSSQLVDEETAVTKLTGNVKVIFPLAATVRSDDVWKENVAVCEVPAAVDIIAVGFETMLEQDASNGDDAALNPWFVILIVLKALSIPDNGTKL